MQAIQNVHLRWKYKTRRVWVSPCRGVLHTPYRYPIRGKRKAFYDQMCKMIFGSKGRLWDVCNTPLPEIMKTWLASLMPWFSFASFLASRQEKKNRSSHLSDRKSIPHTFNRQTQHVSLSLCRGVLHTPYRRSIYGTMNHDNWYGLRIRHPWDGVWWGVCNTPLPGNMNTQHV